MAGGALQLPGFLSAHRSRRGSATNTSASSSSAQGVRLLNDWSDSDDEGGDSSDGENAECDGFEDGRCPDRVGSLDVEAAPRPKRSCWRRSGAKPRRILFRRCAIFLVTTLLLIGGGWTWFWRRENAFREAWIPDAETQAFKQEPLHPASDRTLITDYALPLRTRGRYIIDTTGRRFKLASLNWYGTSDELFVAGGLDMQHRDTIAETVKRLGFNSVRLPYADELVVKNPTINATLVSANPDLAGKTALEILEAVVKSLTDAGVAVIINNHITSATWCCGADPCDAAWANDYLGPICRVKQTEEEWIEHWETVMKPHVDNPLVIGVDLRNEIRGLWGTMPWSKWAPAAEKCGNRLLKMNPDWLVVVEGTESSNDLSKVGERPIKLDVDNRVVYSAHVYAWSGWGSTEGRFLQRTYESFARTMHYNWGYLLEGDVAPVWVGEFGSGREPSVGSANYWQHLMRYLKGVDADFGYWAINPRKPAGNVTETYSLVDDDWVTPLLDYRMKDMVQLMRI